MLSNLVIIDNELKHFGEFDKAVSQLHQSAFSFLV